MIGIIRYPGSNYDLNITMYFGDSRSVDLFNI